jgi:hypothetical protein
VNKHHIVCPPIPASCNPWMPCGVWITTRRVLFVRSFDLIQKNGGGARGIRTGTPTLTGADFAGTGADRNRGCRISPHLLRDVTEPSVVRLRAGRRSRRPRHPRRRCRARRASIRDCPGRLPDRTAASRWSIIPPSPVSEPDLLRLRQGPASCNIQFACISMEV